MQIIEVRWFDSTGYSGQHDSRDEFTTSVVSTIGYFLSEDDKQIVLANEFVEHDVRGVTVIPKVCIVARTDK